MLLRLAYLDVTNAFALLRLPPMSDRDEHTDILALQQQITILQPRPDDARPRFSPGDRAFLAALLHQLPIDLLRRLQLLVRPETVLRWHRDLITRRHAARSRPKRPGRPRTIHSIRLLVLRLARKNPLGLPRANSSCSVSRSQPPPSGRSSKTKESTRHPNATTTTWPALLRSLADALLACDFFEASMLSGTRLYYSRSSINQPSPTSTSADDRDREASSTSHHAA